MAGRIYAESIVQATVADGTYTSGRIQYPELLNGTGYIRFFDANGDQVTPSAGTVLFEVSEDNFHWADVTNGSVDATIGDYARPGYVQGYVCYFRVTLTSVAGASSFEAVLVKNDV